MPVFYVMDRHDQLLDLWRSMDAKDLHAETFGACGPTRLWSVKLEALDV